MIYIDTETTGLTSNDRIIQFAWITEIDTETPKHHNYYIHTDIEIKNSHIHGITNSICMEQGRNLEDVLDIFFQEIHDNNINILIGHNINFDKNMLINNMKAINYQCSNNIILLENMNTYCTMINGKFLMKQRKYPKLIELYKFLFDKEFENAHNAMNDIIATCECYKKLLKEKDNIYRYIMDQIITFGKYKGKTFEHVYTKDRKYLTDFVYTKIDKNRDIWLWTEYMLKNL